MCGIAGIYSQNKSITNLRDYLMSMLNAARHRGPDDQGYYLDKELGCGIGMNRLSIIDRASGNQPIWNEDRSLLIVCNGEIYNHLPLREELISRGHKFSTNLVG